MSKYLYLIALTPSHFLTPLRSKLIEVCLRSLQAQRNDDWEAWVIGEEDRTDGNIQFISSNAVSKKDKLLFALDRLEKLASKPVYLIRFDDDDVVHPDGLNHVEAAGDFDCYRDSWHAQFDIVSGQIRQDRIEWFPNSVVHRLEHIWVPIRKGEVELPLIAADHSLWNQYYEGKRVLSSQRSKPFYVRVMTPSSVSVFRSEGRAHSTSFNMEAYQEFLGPEHNWLRIRLRGYETYFEELMQFWEQQSEQGVANVNSSVSPAKWLRYYLKVLKS